MWSVPEPLIRPPSGASRMSRTNWPIVKREQLWAELDNPTRSALPWHFWRLQMPPTLLDPLSWWMEAGLPLIGTLAWGPGSSTIDFLGVPSSQHSLPSRRRKPGSSIFQDLALVEAATLER